MKIDPYDRFSENKKIPCLFTRIKGIRVTWEVLGVCNLKCKHCCIAAKSDGPGKIDVDLEEYKQIVKNMKESGVKALYLSGGEPLLWKEIYNFISYSKDIGIEMISLATNATLLMKENVIKLAKSGLDKILISLDHHIPEKHEEFRGIKGCFNTTVKACRNIVRYSNIYLRVGCVIWKENYTQLENFVKFCIKLGVNEIAFSWIMKAGRAIENSDIFVPDFYYFKVGEILRNLKEKYKDKIKISYHRFDFLTKKCEDCMGGKKFFYINYAGRIGPCSWISKVFPDKFLTKDCLNDKSFKELIKDKSIKRFLKDEERRFKKFGPGCPAVCTIQNQNFYSKDPLLFE